jgi:hypothetical protein
MVPLSSRSLLAGIWLTQVGYPLPHRQNGVRDSISSNRFVFLSFLSAPEAKDEEVGDLVFLSNDVRQARINPNGAAKASPQSEYLVSSFVGLGSVGGGGDLESSAEISREAVSGAKVSSCQGAGCG